jgi:hypothetical protein
VADINTRPGRGGRPRKPENAELPNGVYAKKRGRNVRYYDRLGTPVGPEIQEAIAASKREKRTRFFSMLSTSKHAVLTEEAIVARSLPAEPQCGVYFLIQDSRIVYIGQSVNVHARLADHWNGEKRFDRVYWVRCAQRDLAPLEAAYIAQFNPPLNKVQPSRTRTFVVREPRPKTPDPTEPQLRFEGVR